MNEPNAGPDAIRHRWRPGSVTLGGWCSIGNSYSAELMGRAGFDWVCVDQQHGLVGPDALVPMLQALSLTRTPTVDPKRALGYVDDLRSLWGVELPESPEHQDIRREYELRRAQATAAGFERLEVLGPVIVEAKVSADPMAGASLALSLQPERAELVGQQADVVRTLLDGHHSRLAHTDTPEARKKRRQRIENGTLRCFGRGERI